MLQCFEQGERIVSPIEVRILLRSDDGPSLTIKIRKQMAEISESEIKRVLYNALKHQKLKDRSAELLYEMNGLEPPSELDILNSLLERASGRKAVLQAKVVETVLADMVQALQSKNLNTWAEYTCISTRLAQRRLHAPGCFCCDPQLAAADAEPDAQTGRVVETW